MEDSSCSSDDNSQVVKVVSTAKNGKDTGRRPDFSDDFTTSVAAAAQTQRNQKQLLGKGKGGTTETSSEDEEGLGVVRIPYRPSRMICPIKRS